MPIIRLAFSLSRYPLPNALLREAFCNASLYLLLCCVMFFAMLRYARCSDAMCYAFFSNVPQKRQVAEPSVSTRGLLRPEGPVRRRTWVLQAEHLLANLGG